MIADTTPTVTCEQAIGVCMQPNVKPQPEEEGAESVSTPTAASTGVSNVQVHTFFLAVMCIPV